MTTRKKKPADSRKKKTPPKKAGLAVRLLTSGASLAGRYPRSSAGAATFIVVFSFVAANALWYQHGVHPSPLLRTRLAFDNPQTVYPGSDPADSTAQPRKVTTFVIKREDAGQATDIDGAPPSSAPAAGETRSSPTRAAEPVPVPDATASIIRAAENDVPTDGGTAAQASSLVADIQTELARRGLYDGAADGRNGPKTQAAILQFEKQAHRRATGLPSNAVLAALRSSQGARTPVKPEQRPYETVKAEKGDLDPVAAAIRSAEVNPDFVPKAEIPSASDLIVSIQKGLANLAYTDVRIDGQASPQTRAAIRHFEKHYRLPETGEPSQRVLKKMKEIGAI